MALSLLVGGNEVLPFVKAGSLSIKANAYSKAGTMAFVLTGEPGDFTVLPEDTVVLADGATVYYGGHVRQLKRSSYDRPGDIMLSVDTQDYTTLLDDDVVHTDGLRLVDESDSARINWLMTSWGTKGITLAHVQSLTASMPPQDFTGKTLKQGVEMILSLSHAEYFVDFGKDLHTFLTESFTAPHGLSDTPNETTTFGYRDIELPYETTALKNAVYIVPGPGTAVPTWYEDAASIALYGRREAILSNDKVTKQTTLNAMGAAFLAEHANPITTGSLTTYEPGLFPSQIVHIWCADHGLLNQPFRITSVETTFPTNKASDPEYKIDFGDPRQNVGKTFADLSAGETPTEPGGTGGGGGGVTWQSALNEGGITIKGKFGKIWFITANAENSLATATVTGGHFVNTHMIEHDYQGILIQEAATTVIHSAPSSPYHDTWLAIFLGDARQNADGTWTSGGGQIIDDGTPSPECYILDTFRRTATGSLGSTDGPLSMAWTTLVNTGTTDYGTNTSGAFIRNNEVSGTADFNAQASGIAGVHWDGGGDFKFTIRFRVLGTIAGSVFRVALAGASTDIVWAAKLSNIDGFVGVVDDIATESVSTAKLDWAANTEYILEGTVTAGGAAVRCYPYGSPQSAWSAETGASVVLDASVDMRIGVLNLPTPATLIWHDLLTCQTGAPLPPFEDFNRIVSGSLGTASNGFVWQQATGAGYVLPSVDGDEATATFSLANNTCYCFFEASSSGMPPHLLLNDFTFTMRFKQTAIGPTSDGIFFFWDRPDFSNAIRLTIDLNSTGSFIGISDFAETVWAPITVITPGASYDVKMEVESGSHIRVKFWATSSTEPSGWDIDLVDTEPIDLSASPLWEFSQQITTGFAMTRYIDFINIIG